MTAIEELHAQRAELVKKKAFLTEQIVAANQRLTVRLPHHDYQRVIRFRNELVRQAQLTEQSLSSINLRRHSAHVEDQKAAGLANVPHFKQLVELRDFYQVFAADPSRSPTMRRMASEFVVKLTPIIRLGIKTAGASE